MAEEIKKSISKDEIKEFEQLKFEGTIYCIDSDEDLIKYLPKIKKIKVLGFDTETKPNFVKGEANQNKVSLLQLASSEESFLVRLPNITMKKELFKVLGNKRIKKIGLAIRDDIKGLQKLRDFTPNNFVDLQQYVEQFGIEDKSLRKITAIVLKMRLSKAQRLSNWENAELQDNQKVYAATDAWVCVEIYNTLKKLKTK